MIKPRHNWIVAVFATVFFMVTPPAFADSLDDAGNELINSVTTEIKIDPRISDDRFVFEAPAV